MTYNFLQKIKKREFSLKEDASQTFEDLYKYVGLEFLVKLSEKRYGQLDKNNRLMVETCYAASLFLLGSAIYNNNTNSGVNILGSFGCFGLGFLHHNYITKQKNK